MREIVTDDLNTYLEVGDRIIKNGKEYVVYSKHSTKFSNSIHTHYVLREVVKMNEMNISIIL